jgi:ferredoxin
MGREMPFVVTENCINCKNTSCVAACAMEAFHEGPNFLVIDPDSCFDCGRCKPACPLGAIMASWKMPASQAKFIQINADLALIWPKITEKIGSIPDSEEWDGVADKLKLLEIQGS